MMIIRNLDGNNNVIEPTNCVEYIEMWNHCVRNVRWLDGTVDYNLVELGMLGRYNNSPDPTSDSDPFFQ